jgi:hypothetical protein
MNKAIALIITLAVGGTLMIYSASRTLALLQMTLPAGQTDMAFLALAAFDGGLIAWVLTFMFGAEGAWQRGISALMIFICLIGVVVGFGADSVIGAVSGGIVGKSTIDSSFGLTVVLATVAIIALNIAAVTAFHVMSPTNRRHMQEESFSDHIEEAAFKKSNEAIPQLAAQLAQELTASRMARLNAKYQNMIVTEQAALPEPVPVEEMPSAAPSRMDAIQQRMDSVKRRLSDTLAPKTETMRTMAADAPPTVSAEYSPEQLAEYAQFERDLGNPNSESYKRAAAELGLNLDGSQVGTEITNPKATRAKKSKA